jgi:hypothetical protein
MKSGSLNLLETSGPVQASNGIAVRVWIRPKSHTNTPSCSNNQKSNRTQPRCLASNLSKFLKIIWSCRNTQSVGSTIVTRYKVVSWTQYVTECQNKTHKYLNFTISLEWKLYCYHLSNIFSPVFKFFVDLSVAFPLSAVTILWFLQKLNAKNHVEL